MKRLLFFFSISCILCCCKNSDEQTEKETKIKTFTYTEMSAPNFLRKLIDNHYNDFDALDNSYFDDFANSTLSGSGSEKDTVIKKKYYTLKILHLLFTCKNATNGSKGEILNIPYYWHWTDPNPRHQITYLQTNQRLNAVNPPKEFARYKSYADIDRTPYLFLSELLSEKPLYSSSDSEFSSFGWCSEREMAYVSLLKTLGFEGKVITNGNHSWSEFVMLNPYSSDKQTTYLKFTIDNTFDKMEWTTITQGELSEWQSKSFPEKGNWYNQKAHDSIELQKIRTFIISPTASKNIEEKVVIYLNQKLSIKNLNQNF